MTLPKSQNHRELVTFKKDSEWVAKLVHKLVTVKREAGIKTSFSHELVRLAINGIRNETTGSKVDLHILENLLSENTDGNTSDNEGEVK